MLNIAGPFVKNAPGAHHCPEFLLLNFPRCCLERPAGLQGEQQEAGVSPGRSPAFHMGDLRAFLTCSCTCCLCYLSAHNAYHRHLIDCGLHSSCRRLSLRLQSPVSWPAEPSLDRDFHHGNKCWVCAQRTPGNEATAYNASQPPVVLAMFVFWELSDLHK